MLFNRTTHRTFSPVWTLRRNTEDTMELLPLYSSPYTLPIRKHNVMWWSYIILSPERSLITSTELRKH